MMHRVYLLVVMALTVAGLGWVSVEHPDPDSALSSRVGLTGVREG